MKKSIALVLVLIMVLSISAAAVADCSHNNWHQVDTSIKTRKQYHHYNSGCDHLGVPHDHWRIETVKVVTSVCFTCGDIKQIRSVSYGPWHCPKN